MTISGPSPLLQNSRCKQLRNNAFRGGLRILDLPVLFDITHFSLVCWAAVDHPVGARHHQNAFNLIDGLDGWLRVPRVYFDFSNFCRALLSHSSWSLLTIALSRRHPRLSFSVSISSGDHFFLGGGECGAFLLVSSELAGGAGAQKRHPLFAVLFLIKKDLLKKKKKRKKERVFSFGLPYS